MVRLRRTVRFSINPGGPPGASPPGFDDGSNGDGGVPAMTGLGRYYELDVTCEGDPDPSTGYLINIKAIDHAVRGSAIPLIARACAETPAISPESLLPQILRSVRDALNAPVRSVRWRLTPSYSVESSMPIESPPRVRMRQRFDLACAHRLHDPARSDEDNRRLFGKCNNPSGHGHNYRVEPCVSVGLSDVGAPALTLPELESIVDRVIVQPFDHTHLNEDTEAFAPGSGVNPSVENIARVFFDLLAPAIRDASPNAELTEITVWETDRTSCTYPG